MVGKKPLKPQSTSGSPRTLGAAMVIFWNVIPTRSPGEVKWSNGPMGKALVLLALSVIHTDEYFKLPVIIIINVSKQHSHLHHDDPEHLVVFDVAQVLTRAHNLPSEGKIVARLASGPPRGCS